MSPGPDELDLLDPAVLAEPWAAYERLCREAPVHEMPGTGLFVVTPFEAVCQVLADPETFSSELGGDPLLPFKTAAARNALTQRGWPPLAGPLAPELSARVERLLSDPRGEAYARAVVEDQLLLLGSAGECELVSDFCLPVSFKGVAARLGLPLEELPRLAEAAEVWTRPFGFGLTPELEEEIAGRLSWLHTFLAEQVEERRAAPQPDLLSELASHAGPEDATDAALRLWLAGHEATASALAAGVLVLSEDEDRRRALREAPDRIGPFIDEVLRLEAPVQGVTRRATRDAELLGVKIPKGRWVHARLGAASRDPAGMPDGDASLAFGAAGACPGRGLARMLMRAAFEGVLERWSHFERADPEAPLAYLPSFVHRGLLELRIRFRTRD